MRFFRSAGIVFIFALYSSTGLAQQPVSDCEQALNQATDEFNAGRFYGIAAMLKNCLDKGFTREQRQRANLLLAQTYLLLDDPVGAESSYINVLWANPEFVADTIRDPIDLVYLSKKFTADPIFSLFVKAGGNTSPVRVIHTINPSGEAGVENNYTLKTGWQFGGGVAWNIVKEISVTAEFIYSFTSYQKTQVKFNLDKETFIDNQNWFSLPISLKYSDTKGNVRPFGYVGFAMHWLAGDRGQVTSLKTDIVNGQPTAIPNESPSITLTKYRNSFNRSIFLGGGVRYKLGLDFVFADLRYGMGLGNVVVPTTNFDTTGPMVEWGHVDDYFRLDNLSLSIGYVKPLYKPRKLKYARTKSVLRGINKKKK